MRYLFALLLLPVLLFGQYKSETFEGAGAPTDWGSTTGSPDYDFTGTVLFGSQSLRLPGTSGTVTSYVTFVAPPISEVYVRFAFQITRTNLATAYFQQFYNTTTQVSYWGINTSGNVTGVHGTGTDTGDLTIALNTTYYAWIYYKAAASGDGIMQVRISTTGYYADATLEVDISNGSKLSAFNRIYYLVSSSTGADVIVDNLEISDDLPGDFFMDGGIIPRAKNLNWTEFGGWR